MTALHSLSIKAKLMWLAMLTSGTALVLLYAGFVAYEFIAFPSVIARKLWIQAQMIGANSASALLFSDPGAASETLAALRADRRIVAAAIYDREGRAFARYVREDRAGVPGLPEQVVQEPEGHRFESGHLVLHQAIAADGETLGSIYIQSDLEELSQRIGSYAGIAAIALLLSFLVAVLIAFRLQRGISRPILDLAETASAVSVHKDYSVRAAAEGDNELGRLVAALNEMLAQIQRRDAELAASESRHRALMEQANDAILILDVPHRVLEVNHEAERLLGLPREQILGRHYDEFVVEEERVDSARRQRELLLAGAARVESRRLLQADGTVVEVELSASVVQVGEDLDERAVLLILRDSSERRSLEAQLLQAQKIESLGRLAGGVAHDFNNVLGIVIGYTELLCDRLPDDPHLRRYADDILQAANRAAALTRQLLAFSRRQVLQPRVLSLNEVVRESEKMLRRLIGEDILLETRLDEHLLPVRADAGQLEQVVMNLAVNARDAMPLGGRLLLETRPLELDADFARAHPGVQPGLYVSLVVSDNGHGMPPEVLANIFEPFFTTKAAGKGTGLGLPTVHGIVRQSGGHVFVYSEVGHGTTFRICLPAIRDTVLEAELPAAEAAPPKGSETVLVVEDEPALGDIVRQSLQALGYTVLLAPQAEAALEVSRRHEGPIALLITDVVMPGMGGSQLAKRLAASRPETRTLFMSGFTDDAVLLQGVATDSLSFLEKPFTGVALARKVRAVLDRA